MKRYNLAYRPAVLEVLYPKNKGAKVSTELLAYQLGSLGVGVIPLQRNGMEGAQLSIPAGPQRALVLDTLGGSLALWIEVEREGEVHSCAFQVPFTPFHAVVRPPVTAVATAAVRIIPHHRNPRLQVALGMDANMKLFLYGAHPKSEGNGVRVKMPGASYELLLQPDRAAIVLRMVRPGSTEDISNPQRFTTAGHLHRVVSGLTMYHQQTQHRKAEKGEPANV